MKQTIEQQYKLLDEISHVRQRPGMYVGSIVSTTGSRWVVDNGKMAKQDITYNPGVLKIFCEILDNSIDEHKRNPSKVTAIKVNVNQTTGEISVHDNGGIPVELHKETNEYVPSMIFSNLRSGSNFDDSHDQALVGTNGVGSTLVAILSKSFEIISCDGKKSFTQVFSNGLRDKSKPIVKSSTANFTKITFIPDYEYFSENGLTDDNYKKIIKRVYDCAGCNPNIEFYLNGVKIKFNSFKDYISVYTSECIFEENTDWSIGVSHSRNGFEHISFVNSVETSDGGSHIDYVMTPIITALREYFTKKYKFDVKPSDIKQHIMVFINASINRPKFNSQTKTMMVSEPKEYKTEWKPSDAFIKKILKSDIVEEIITWAENKQKLEELAALKKKNKDLDKSSLRNITKYETATSKNRGKCLIFIAEGDSAAKSLQSARDPEYHGVYPFKGKPLNVRGMKFKELIENKELNELMQIIGLQFGKEHYIYELRYSKLIISTDQDLDGFHLCGLTINIFQELWPSLVKQGFLVKLETPIVRVSQGKNEIEFFSIEEFNEWEQKQTKTYQANYLKGLGSNDTKYFKKYMFDEKYHIPITFKDTEDSDALDIAFDKKKADERKKYIYGEVA